MAPLVQPGKYGATNTDDSTTNVFYVIKLISESCTLQNNTKIYGKILSAGKSVFKAQYICSMQEDSNWYRKQQSLKHNIIVTTPTILHPCLDVIRLTYVQETPKTICNRIQAKKPIQRYPIFLTDADYDYILDEIERRYKIEFERNVSVNCDEK